MADQSPDNSDIETIFNRLRLIPANKVCFDCCAKNPTWSSVTYGVFICIDCSAVHRSLGVHLTFVRSTQLDTNWTWLQIRQMQLGGNANADQFFRQHNCMTSDTQQKYTSRAASLYRDKLQNAAQQAIRLHGTQLFLDTHVEHSPEKKDVDFFEELSDSNKAASFGAIGDSIRSSTAQNLTKGNTDTSASKPGPEVGPKIDGSCLMATERKPTIGVRKIQPRRSELGARKGGGLGATKVKTNFADIEREANLADKLKEQSIEDIKNYADSKAEDEEKTMASMRLAYKDLSVRQSKEEERLKISDPKKALQMERLGMGFASSRSGVSHSALSDMHTIEQDNLAKTQSNFSKNPVDSERDVFFDDYNFTSMNMYTPQGGESKMESFMDGRGYGNSEIIEPESRQPIRTMFSQDDKPKPKPSPARTPVDDDAAQKKFGSAKAISSDQYFNEGASQFERNANLSRFQGSSSISSADYFGDGSGLGNKNNSYSAYQGAHFNAPDMEDVKESVRQGVTKVAGKLSSLATGVMSSLQDKYGY